MNNAQTAPNLAETKNRVAVTESSENTTADFIMLFLILWHFVHFVLFFL